MKIACLILAHKNPKQLERLIRSLDHPSFHFFIHLDAKSPMPEFDYLRTIPGVYFVRRRVRVRWAGYSLVQATINGMEEIIGTGQYDYINLLSAQDFPLQPASAILEFFRTHQGKEFITCWVDDGTNEWWKENTVRIKKYHLENWSIPGKYRLQFLLNRILPGTHLSPGLYGSRPFTVVQHYHHRRRLYPAIPPGTPQTRPIL